ncbi:COMM domain-containing protein 6 isoform X1 [Alligator mississippiensis]|uniref:COMM domain-containing protein 6 isoform X1 n=1 Tax=Alligator mississippiensis TaxID=8496 RepID=UPI002877A790|nr:COMM domain-containing protein 6 isoform X1 [Alligator mississippiensis]
MAAAALVKALEPFDFGNTADVIRSIPQDLFAELCEQIIQHLCGKIPGVNAVELCQRFRTSGIALNVSDLAKVVNVVSFLFSTAAKNNISAEELSTSLSSTVNVLPKHAIQVIRHVWNEQGKSISVSEEARNMATVGQLIDIQWKLGMAVSSDSCRSLKYPYVTMTLKVADPSGQITSKSFEMTVPQFQASICAKVDPLLKKHRKA